MYIWYIPSLHFVAIIKPIYRVLGRFVLSISSDTFFVWVAMYMYMAMCLDARILFLDTRDLPIGAATRIVVWVLSHSHIIGVVGSIFA